jgi:hypothetical protein
MALAEVVGPYIDNPDDQSWRGSMLALSQPHEGGAGWPGSDADATGMARQQPDHPREQYCVHGRVLDEGRDQPR